jgi:hypothetical protein
MVRQKLFYKDNPQIFGKKPLEGKNTGSDALDAFRMLNERIAEKLMSKNNAEKMDGLHSLGNNIVGLRAACLLAKKTCDSDLNLEILTIMKRMLNEGKLNIDGLVILAQLEHFSSRLAIEKILEITEQDVREECLKQVLLREDLKETKYIETIYDEYHSLELRNWYKDIIKNIKTPEILMELMDSGKIILMRVVAGDPCDIKGIIWDNLSKQDPSRIMKWVDNLIESFFGYTDWDKSVVAMMLCVYKDDIDLYISIAEKYKHHALGMEITARLFNTLKIDGPSATDKEKITLFLFKLAGEDQPSPAGEVAFTQLYEHKMYDAQLTQNFVNGIEGK